MVDELASSQLILLGRIVHAFDGRDRLSGAAEAAKCLLANGTLVEHTASSHGSLAREAASHGRASDRVPSHHG